MASQMPSISRQEANTLVRQVQSTQLINRQLSSVCQVNGLKSTGVKAELQRRIINLIQETVNANDVSRFHQIRQSIANAFALRSSPSKGASSRNSYGFMTSSPVSLTGNSASAMQAYSSNSTTAPRDYRVTTNGHRTSQSYTAANPVVLMFKPSPFYHIMNRVSDVRTCEVMQQHRHSISIPVKISDHATLEQCLNDKSCRIMIFSAADSSGVQDIAFPHQSELRVNGDEIKANLRGLKNKPGSTKPADITHALRIKTNYPNNVEFIYALTTKKFYVVLQLCKVKSVSELVSTISTRRIIPKMSVVEELNKKAQDPDVVATSQVLSLKCPLSYMRLDVPCRGMSCTHIQCFDATSYLQLQEQGPQWVCPICSKPVPFEQLAVDEYVRDILAKTSKSLETVTIEPNGRWLIKAPEEEKPTRSTNGTPIKPDEDDDEVKISEISFVGGRRFETPRSQVPQVDTPSSSGRGNSNGVAQGATSASRKRPAEVIDLTLSSSDEDDEPIQRPNKRRNVGSNGGQSQESRNFFSESPLGCLP